MYTDGGIGVLDTVVVEVEYESLAQYEQVFTAWMATVSDEHGSQWRQLTQDPITSEFWKLVE